MISSGSLRVRRQRGKRLCSIAVSSASKAVHYARKMRERGIGTKRAFFVCILIFVIGRRAGDA